tara:strand:- start:780 stop:1043 length:264 start_codon:yes stop_codon:yes gene_type:complete
MNNQNTIEIQAVGDMSIGQQQAHARRNGKDNFISTDGRLYIRSRGKWELMPLPKLSAADEAAIREIAVGQPESVIQQLITISAFAQQ